MQSVRLHFSIICCLLGDDWADCSLNAQTTMMTTMIYDRDGQKDEMDMREGDVLLVLDFVSVYQSCLAVLLKVPCFLNHLDLDRRPFLPNDDGS